MAQSTPPAGVTIPPTTPDTIEQTIPNPSELPRIPPKSPQLPAQPIQTPLLPLPLIPRGDLKSPQPPEVTSPPSARFLVRKVDVLGSTVLRDQIAALTKSFENREVTFEDLIGLRSAIIQLYIENGYVTSGAFLLNNQVLSKGVVQIQVVEGELERIELSGLSRLQEQYVRSRIAIAAKRPLNRQRLEEALQLLQLDPSLEQVNAELTAGSTPGRNILQVKLKEAPAFHGGVSTENRQSPSVGSVQTDLFVAHDNLLGFGDRLSAEYGITEGLDIYELNYAIPVNAHNGTLGLRYSNSDSRIIEDDFRDLDIRSETRTFSLSFRQPMSRSPESEFALSLALDLRRSQTFLLDDIPFSFSEGPEDGESKVTVIRFSQDWVDRGARRVLAARSQFSVGLDAFDATINDTGTDGQFFAWLGQFQWVQQLTPRTVLLARIDAQLTPDSLLTLEQFSIGGVDTVRGYRQNELVADNGILGSVEVRFPLTSDSRVLQLSPFFDIGTVWSNRGPDPDPTTIASLGLGLRWLINPDFSLRLDYGIPLIAVNNRDDSLQEDGLYFSVRYQPF
jgi:hemolysin activation/secretion protein